VSTRATKEKTGAEPRTKNRTLALALGGRATVAGWLGYGIGYSIPRVEISPGIYIYYWQQKRNPPIS
jgi:hypothetical protein